MGAAAAILAGACSDDGTGRQNGPGSTGGGGGSTGSLVTSADGDDGIDPSVPTATSPGSDEGTTAGLDSTAGSTSDPTKPTDSGDADGDGSASAGSESDGGTTMGVGGSSDSGTPDDGLTFGTGGTQETLEFVDTDGLPTFGETGAPATNCVSIDVPADGYDVVVAVELEVAMAHTWIGDVTIELVAPGATALTVLNRAGHPAAGNFGDDSDVVAASPLTFFDGAGASAEQMGSMLGAALTICASDAICEYFAAPDAAGTGAAVGTSFADFAGVAADGQWQVCFTDHADEDPLTVSGATLRITKSM